MSRGEENIHIYQIELELYENDSFYRRDDGILTLTTDPEFPYRSNRISVVGSTTNTTIGTVAFRKKPLPYTCGDKVTIPTFGIREEEWDNEITINIIATLQSAKGIYDHNDYSVFITRKKFEDNIWQVGLAATTGYGEGRFVRNETLERYINHLSEFNEL